MEPSLEQQVMNLLKYDIPDDVILNFLKPFLRYYECEQLLLKCKDNVRRK